ncbi:hypothetical protein MalM25_25680 [Planctomycetes bacterium MalM25]|nr:hypothetical protein MalM25_25680 [Planctomycetes bacterium MalM25]
MRPKHLFRIAAVLLVSTAWLWGPLLWIALQPAWEVSARNTPDGVAIEFYVEGAVAPAYSALLEGSTIPRDITRLTREEIPAEVATVAFYDDTLKPGLLRLDLAGREVTVMERCLSIDGEEVATQAD